MGNGLIIMRSTKMLAGVTHIGIWGVHHAQATKYVNEGSFLALKPRPYITRGPKQGVSGPKEMTYVSKNVMKEKKWGPSHIFVVNYLPNVNLHCYRSFMPLQVRSEVATKIEISLDLSRKQIMFHWKTNNQVAQAKGQTARPRSQ